MSRNPRKSEISEHLRGLVYEVGSSLWMHNFPAVIPWIITIPEAHKTSLLLPQESCADGHRGVWMTNQLIPEMGMVISFQSQVVEVIRVLVLRMITQEEFKSRCGKVCSDLNTHAFEWVELEESSGPPRT